MDAAKNSRTHLIFSTTGGRFLPESTPWIVNTASSAVLSFTFVCTKRIVVGESKLLIVYFDCHWGSYFRVVANLHKTSVQDVLTFVKLASRRSLTSLFSNAVVFRASADFCVSL